MLTDQTIKEGTVLMCSYCGNDLQEDETENPYTDSENQIMCDNCYREAYEDYCIICEEWYSKPEKPTDANFVLSKEGEKETGLKAGIYHVLKYPVFSAAVGGLGSTYLFHSNFEIKRECDINAMLIKLHGKHCEKINGAEFICPSCTDRFSRTENFNQVRHLYVHNRTIQNVYERGIIQSGK